MALLNKIAHLRKIGSVHWPTLFRALMHLYPDYLSGRGQTHSLVNITLEITYRCNFRCDFCFLKDGLLNRSGTELTLDEISGIVAYAAEQRLSFFLTGGEPFVRKDCETIIETIRKQGLKVGVNSNISLLNEKRIDAFGEFPPNYIITSLHGPEPVHNAVTGTDSWSKVVRNLKYLRKRCANTRLLINNVITRETLPYMEAIVEIAADCGVDIVTLQHESFLTQEEKRAQAGMWERLFGKAPDFQPANQTHPAEAALGAQVRERLEEVCAAGRNHGVSVFFKPNLRNDAINQWYSDAFRMEGRCSYLYTDIRINPFGDVVACQPLPYRAGNLREADLAEIVNGEAMIAFRKNIQRAGGLYPGCARCCKLYRRF